MTGVVRRKSVDAGEITTEPRAILLKFILGQREIRWHVRGRAVEHRYRGNSPTQAKEGRHKIGQQLSRPKFRFLSFAARYEDLVEHFDLSSQGITFEFSMGRWDRTDRSVIYLRSIASRLGAPRSSAWITINDVDLGIRRMHTFTRTR
jgi:hypothetical protein